MEVPEKEKEQIVVSKEFSKLMDDIIRDLKHTFPEYAGIIDRWDVKYPVKQDRDLYLFKHCIHTLPERFFDILYKNKDIFEESSIMNTEFLPGIVFKQLWQFDISDKTKETLWNYLQLIAFSIMGSVKSLKDFGDTAKMFDSIDENELKSKLEETLDGLRKVFDGKETMDASDLPNPEAIHEHLQGMMGGKLGQLAMELAEETAKELEVDMKDATSSQEVFQKLMSNPSKLMNMVKSVGGKIDSKLKTGELNESELMSEGMDLLNKMRDIPGMENMQEIFNKMGLGKGVKLNTGAMEARLAQMDKMEKMKARMRNNVEKKKMEKQAATDAVNAAITQAASQPTYSEEQLIAMFSNESTTANTNAKAKPENAGKNKKKKVKK